MHERGITSAQLAAVAVTQRRHAALHPGAAQRTPISIADVLASPIVSTPLHLLDCCLVTDFQAAAVVVSPKLAAGMSDAVPILGTGEAHGRLTTAAAPLLGARGAGLSASRALAQAGFSLDDLDFAELYDSFSVTVLATLEEIGISAPGEAGRDAERGDFAASGRLPVNTNGGMLSCRTGGFSHVIEAVEQLRGTPPGLALAQPQLGLVTGIGGVLSAHGALVLGAPG
jgi:acetyl-CoA acetyltransferase